CAVEVRHRAQRQDQMIEPELVPESKFLVMNPNLLVRQINRLHIGNRDACPAQHLAQRLNDGSDIHVAARHLMQHWREQHEVLVCPQRHFPVRMLAEMLPQPACRVGAGEPATEDQYALLLQRTSWLVTTVPSLVSLLGRRVALALSHSERPARWLRGDAEAR